MEFNFTFVILLLGPVVLLALWAGYRIATRKPSKPLSDTARSDREERTELTGKEQARQRTDQ
jgi:hypothetical protein